MQIFTYADYLKCSKSISYGVREEYFKKLEKGGNVDMKFEKLFMELLEDKEKKGEELGITKAITQIVKEMIQKQMSDEDIMDITKIDKEELQKLKMA